MADCCRHPKNICHFEGSLYSFSLSIVGDGHPLGKGEVRLIEAGGFLYQSISIVAWYGVAERLSEVPEGSWIKVLGSYDPNTYGGRTYPQFTVNTFSVL